VPLLDFENATRCGKAAGESNVRNHKAFAIKRSDTQDCTHVSKTQMWVWVKYLHEIAKRHDNLNFGVIMPTEVAERPEQSVIGEATDRKRDGKVRPPPPAAPPLLNGAGAEPKPQSFKDFTDANHWLEAEVDKLRNTVPTLHKAVLLFSQQAVAREKKLAAEEEKIKTLREEFDTHKQKVGTLETTSSKHTENIAANKGSNEALARRVAEENADLKKLIALQQSALNELKGRVAAISKNLHPMMNIGNAGRPRRASVVYGADGRPTKAVAAGEPSDKTRRRMGSIAERLARQNQMP